MNFDALSTLDVLVWEEVLLFLAATLAWTCFLVVWGFKVPQAPHWVRTLFQFTFAVFMTRAYFLRVLDYPRTWWTNAMIIILIVGTALLIRAFVRDSGLLGRRSVQVEDVR